MNAPEAYLVAGTKPWNRRVFDRTLSQLPGRWEFIGEASELTRELLASVKPRYVFFLHWSTKVPEWATTGYECVVFHMTDVPFGRGGSPLQNLIERGFQSTKLTAMRMTAEMDAGPVYLKRDLSLLGGAEEIFIRASELSASMIQEILSTEPNPTAQEGSPTVFKRRTPAQSKIEAGELGSLSRLFDHIRMLDAEGYPRAFVDEGPFRFTLARPAFYDGRIVADVTITLREDTK